MAGSGSGSGRAMSSKVKSILLENLIVILMVVSLIIGVGLGFGLRGLEGWEYYQKKKIFYLQFPGQLLLGMLKMLVLPLIVSSIISSLASLNAKASGRMGARAVVYYMTTTFSAVILGIILVLLIRPGDKGGEIDREGASKEQEPLFALFDLVRNCFPDNLVQMAFKRKGTVVEDYNYTMPAPDGWNATLHNETVTELGPNNETLIVHTTDKPIIENQNGMNVLGVVVFSIFLGGILSAMGEKGRPLTDFFECLHQAMMKLTMLVIWYSPIGIMFLVAAQLVAMKNPADVFLQLAYYMLTVLVGLAIHAFIILPAVYLIAVRKNPFIFTFNMLKALVTAWGTASSSATLAVTLECLELRNKVDIRVAKFVAPIGATINMDGTALYEAVAAIFIAQVNGVGLNVGQVITVSLTATAAAIGAAGIPSAGLVTMTIVLTAVGLPTEDITLILAIDWFLDRFRTAVNVLGDSFGAGIVEHLSRADLLNDQEHQELGYEVDNAVEVDNSSYKLKNDVDLGNINATFVDSEDKEKNGYRL